MRLVGRLDAPGQMALDEACLDLAPAGTGFLRFYDWAGPAVTFGLSQSYAMAAGMAQAKGLAGAPVVRRISGGGVVFHDGDFTFSIVFPWERLTSALGVYECMHVAVRQGLKACGIETVVAGPGQAADACFDAPSPFDLVLPDGRKLLGGALRRRAGKGLYQGSLRPELIGLPLEALREAVVRGIRERWPCPWADEPQASWLEEAERLRAKYLSDDWNRRR
ncbi:MAG: lipoate--protein ligase family protein [Elusimicrobia bacterium]|nr:lipoate--protein ligase family protein [Elusimicrobiota bacterium]